MPGEGLDPARLCSYETARTKRVEAPRNFPVRATDRIATIPTKAPAIYGFQPALDEICISIDLATWYKWRCGAESNRRIGVLQTPALPLGYRTQSKKNHINQVLAVFQAESGKKRRELVLTLADGWDEVPA